MKNLSILLLFCTCAVFAQPKFGLTPKGFEPIEMPRPNKTNEKLIEASKTWADYYNKQEHDVYDVTENSLAIDAMRDNAFFYRNVGETFSFRINYTLEITFEEKVCKLTFIVKEIYAKKTLMKMTVPDFFTPDGELKDDLEEAKPSLEKTANNILKSYMDFISN